MSSYGHLPYGGHEKGIIKPVNYDKLREITQGPDENLALFQSCLAGALQKYANLDPSIPEASTLLAVHFIGQSASDTRRKL